MNQNIDSKEENINCAETPDAGQKLFSGKDIYDIFEVFFQSIIIIAILFVFVFRFSVVNGDSMRPTVESGNWMILSNIGFEPRRGTVVVVSQPNYLDEVLIKRIIALPGETIDITKDGYVTIDGQRLQEPYVADLVRERGDVDYPHTVPQGMVFVMGDNRNHSADSRYDGINDIDLRYVVGEAKFRLFPFGGFSGRYENETYLLSDGRTGEINE